MDYTSCLEVYGLWKGDLLMIKGFLLAFDVILIAMFLVLSFYAAKIKENRIGVLMATVSIIILLNSMFILNA